MKRMCVVVIAASLFTLSFHALAGESMKKGKQTPKKAKEPKTEKPTTKEEKTEVFATANGKKYHSTDKCSFLARSKKVEKITKEEAEKKGLMPCEACKDGVAEPKAANPDEVFFTPNGKRYHSSKSCTTLARSKKVQTGTLTEVEDKGLEPCKSCVKSAEAKDEKQSDKSEEMKKKKKK